MRNIDPIHNKAHARNAKLTILASLSLVTLAAVAWGYVGDLGLSMIYVSVTPSGKTDHGVCGDISGGQFTVTCGGSQNPVRVEGSPGLHIFRAHDFGPSLAPDWRWGFHFVQHKLPGYRVVELQCPLWFAALPFTIAPIAWLRRRRRRETRGFAVEATAQG